MAIGWGVLEFVDWLVSRYALAPHITDLSLAVWAAMIPTVLILAYYHGEKGGQAWTRVEKIGIPANLLGAVAVLAFMLTGPESSGINAASASSAQLDPTRIGVLYFDDESEARDLGHLASAFTGALIDELTQVKALDVIPRSSVKPYRGASVSLDSITRDLMMGTLVEGSVSGSKDRLVLSVTLIDPASQTNLESFTLDGPVAEWLDLRDELAAEVARLLRQRLGVEIKLRERLAGTESDEALTLVEKAEELRLEADALEAAGASAAAERELARADGLLEQAELLDPLWVEPIVVRGWVASDRAMLSSLTPGAFDDEEVRRGLTHGERALELEPGDASALELRGFLRFRMSRAPELTHPTELREAAEADLRAAVAADPFRAHAWNTLSELHKIETEFAESKRDAERALEADPFLEEADIVIWRLYESSQELKDMDEAVRWCEEGHRRFPEKDYFVYCSLFMLSLSEGPEPKVETAWALADTSLQLAAPEQQAQLELLMHAWAAAVVARAGLGDSARAVIERVRNKAQPDLRPWMGYYAANVRLLLGERDEALDLLSAFLEAIPQRKEYLAADWMFQDLWDDPQFRELVGATP